MARHKTQTYSEEFHLEAVGASDLYDKTAVAVASDLDIHVNQLYTADERSLTNSLISSLTASIT